MKTGISAVYLAYHEEENLKTLLPRVIAEMEKLPEEYEIVVVDTKVPTDDTKGVCERFGARYINQTEPGLGGAFRAGIQAARYDKYLTSDSDGSHDPAHIPAIYQKFTGEACDVVIGSRYVRGGRTDDARTSIAMSRILNVTFRLVLGIKAKDISTNFRMYRTEQLKTLHLESTNYDMVEEVLVMLMLQKPDLKVGETPIHFQKRIAGESKRRLIPFIIDYVKSLDHLFLLRFPFFRNLLLYGIFGATAALIEYGVFSLLTLKVFTSRPEISNIIGALCGFAFTFSMNTFVNFKKTKRLFGRFLSYALIAAGGMAISTGLVHVLKDAMNIYLLKGILLVFVSLLQFILNRLITYRN